MSLYPDAGSDTPPTSSSHRRFQVGIHVDRAWRDHPDVTPSVYATLVVATSKASKAGRVVARLATIARTLGRDSERATDQVRRDLRVLERVGALTCSRTRGGAGVTELRLQRAAGGYDVIPWEIVRALEAGSVDGEVLRTWAHLDQRMGREGWTRDSNADLAASAGVSTRTVPRHLAQLEGIGMVRRGGGGVRTIARAGANLPTEPRKGTTAGGSGRATGAGPHDTDAGSGHDTDAGSIELTPDDSLTPEISPSSRSACHRGERDGGRKRPEGGIYAKPEVAEVRDLLEQQPAWRGLERAAWQARILTLAWPALQQGMTPAAVAHALAVRGRDAIDEAIELAQPLVGPAQRVIREVRIDIKLGDACRECGRDAVEAGQVQMTAGRCRDCRGGCREETGEEIPAEVLAEVYAHLGVTAPEPSTSTTVHDHQDDQESTSEEQTMITIGAQSRLTREVLESATPQERADLLAQRVQQVEQLREQRHDGHSDRVDAGPTPAEDSPSTSRADATRERWPGTVTDLEAERPRRRAATPAPTSTNERRRVLRRRAQERRRAGGPPARVDADRARQHLQALRDLGYSASVLAALAHVDPGTVRNLLLDPETHPRAARLIGRDLEQQVLDAEFDLDLLPETSHVPAEPTRRRFRALAAIGWSLAELAEQVGVTEAAVSKTAHASAIQAGVARRYRDLYAQLENTPGPSDRARHEAQKRGWAPPAAWENIDDLTERPDTARPAGGQHIYLEDLQDCASWGLDIAQAAVRLGVTKDAIEACARRARRRDVLDRLRANRIERSVA